MVILMGVRLDRYREEKKKEHRKLYGFIRRSIIISMFIGLWGAIIYINKTIDGFNYIDNTTLLDVNISKREFTFLGKSYIIEFEKILSFIKPD